MRFVSLAVAAVVALAAAPAATAWTWPADGPVVQGFALGADPYAAGQHRGIDIGGTPGDPVQAPAGGRVSYAGTLPHYGRSLTIRTDDGWVVTLLHLGTLGVARGAVVSQGQTVATLGSSGEAEHEAPSVHLGIRHADDEHGYVDPVSLLPARPVAPSPVAAPAPPPAAAPVAVAPGPVPVAAPTPPPTAAPAPEPAPAAPEPVVAAEPQAPAPMTEQAPVPAVEPAPVAVPLAPVVPVAAAPRAPARPRPPSPPPVTIHATPAEHAPTPVREARRRLPAAVPPRKATPAGRGVVRAPAHPVPAATRPSVTVGAAGRDPAGGSAEPPPRASGRPFGTSWLPPLLVTLVAIGACTAVRRRRGDAIVPARVGGPCPIGRRAVARPACRRAPLRTRTVPCRPVPRTRARPRRARVAVMA
jgi:peptidase M23-like protein